MEKLNSINEAIFHLKEKEVLTTSKKDYFVYKKDRVYRYFDGSCFTLDIDDFKELYRQENFYIYEDDNVYIDNDKDEAYYRYYKK